MTYYTVFERFDKQKLPEQCYFVMHLHKEYSPLYAVHLKSIITGGLLIFCGMYNYQNTIVVLGACIIGLHLAQFVNEYALITRHGAS
jgi:hypothetical protein